VNRCDDDDANRDQQFECKRIYNYTSVKKDLFLVWASAFGLGSSELSFSKGQKPKTKDQIRNRSS
jgi:hypothetical protein